MGFLIPRDENVQQIRNAEEVKHLQTHGCNLCLPATCVWKLKRIEEDTVCKTRLRDKGHLEAIHQQL